MKRVAFTPEQGVRIADVVRRVEGDAMLRPKPRRKWEIPGANGTSSSSGGSIFLTGVAIASTITYSSSQQSIGSLSLTAGTWDISGAITIGSNNSSDGMIVIGHGDLTGNPLVLSVPYSHLNHTDSQLTLALPLSRQVMTGSAYIYINALHTVVNSQIITGYITARRVNW